MDFIDIPQEVIEDHLLPFLQWNDLLRFRRASPFTKSVTDHYLAVNLHLAPEIEIREDDEDKSFLAFLRMGIPTTKLFIDNPSGRTFYEKENGGMVQFYEKHGHQIQNLRVSKLSVYVYGKERDFMEALVNIKSLDVGHLGYGQDPADEVAMSPHKLMKIDRISAAVAYGKDPRISLNRSPVSFRMLEVLKIAQCGCLYPWTSGSVELEFMYIGAWVQPFWPFDKLQYSGVPPYFMPPSNEALSQSLNALIVAMDKKKGHEEFPVKRNLKWYDFKSYDFHKTENLQENDSYSRVQRHDATEVSNMLKFCQACIKHDIKLLNVGSSWFIKGLLLSRDNFPEMGLPVVSLVNLSFEVLHIDMPNLEFVDIQDSSNCIVDINWKRSRREWPALRRLDINVDSKYTRAQNYHNAQLGFNVRGSVRNNEDVSTLYNIFFQNTDRLQLSQLTLKFTADSLGASIPKTENIVATCPNLRKMALCNWRGSNRAVTKLWNGLHGLEEVSLEYCENLGNIAFVGEDVRNPVFLKLKKIKKLTLKGLDKMPKITDTLFTVVLSHLKLTHLLLTSDEPLVKVTAAGIASLLDGELAGSIEKFPFREWSLANATKEEFKELEMKFRSYNML